MSLAVVASEPGTRINRDEALRRARSLADIAGRNARLAEEMRELPDENVDALNESELAMLLVPERWGGFALDWETALDCVIEVGKTCGSTAWCLSFVIDHNWVLSLYPETAQTYVYSRDPRPLIFTASAPEGKVTSVPGGYLLNGEWSWASGSHHCPWGLIGAVLLDAGPPKYLNLLIDPGNAQVIDNWHQFGLKGTGSSNIRLTDVFVPAEHVVEWASLGQGTAPGQEVNSGPLYRLPLGTAYPLGIMGPMLGVAKGALADFVAFTANKLGAFTGEKVAEQAPLQARIGEAGAMIDTADMLIRNNARMLVQENVPDMEERVRFKRDYLFAGQLLIDAVDMLMNAAGARAGRLDNSMQRAFRDIHAMRQHVLFSFDITYASAGRMLMGMGPDPRDRV